MVVGIIPCESSCTTLFLGKFSYVNINIDFPEGVHRRLRSCYLITLDMQYWMLDREMQIDVMSFTLITFQILMLYIVYYLFMPYLFLMPKCIYTSYVLLLSMFYEVPSILTMILLC